MTIDKEKLLKGLMVCTRPGLRTCFFVENVCPYDENGCKMGMMEDAIVLIKEQDSQIKELTEQLQETERALRAQRIMN